MSEKVKMVKVSLSGPFLEDWDDVKFGEFIEKLTNIMSDIPP